MNGMYRQPGIRLQDVVSNGAVERGLYLVMGGESVAHEVESRLLDVLEAEHYEMDILPPHTPTEGRPWRRPSRLGPLFWLDAASEFHRLRFEIAARRRGLDADRTLRAVRVEKVESVTQLNDRLIQIPNPALLASFGSSWWTPFIALTGISSLFPDTMPDDLASEQFHEFTVRLAHLRRRAVVVCTWGSEKMSPRQRVILQALLNLGRRVMTQSEALNAAAVAGKVSREAVLMGRGVAA